MDFKTSDQCDASFRFQEEPDKPEFCVNSLVAKVLKDYVQVPDHSELREKLEEKMSGFVSLRQRLTLNEDGTENTCKRWCKILFANADSVIVQDVEMVVNNNHRFAVRNIPYEDWAKWLVEYVMPEHDDFFVVYDCWTQGMEMYM